MIELIVTGISAAAEAGFSGGGNPLSDGLLVAATIGSTLAFIVGFFAKMLYIRWLAPRLPSVRVFKRAKTLMWLGPVLYTFGLLLIGLGPLIALVL